MTPLPKDIEEALSLYGQERAAGYLQPKTLERLYDVIYAHLVHAPTQRQRYKEAALSIIDSRYTNVGNEAACVYEVARYAGMIADAFLAEDAEHAGKQKL